MIIVIVRWKRVVGDRQKNKDEIEEVKGRSGGGRIPIKSAGNATKHFS